MRLLSSRILVSYLLIIFTSIRIDAQESILNVPMCQYPRKAVREPRPSMRPDAWKLVNGDVEPNNDITTAQRIPLGYGQDQDPDVDLLGDILAPFDQDFFSFHGQEGFVFGVACIDTGDKGKRTNSLDPQIVVFDPAGKQIFFNDNHMGIASKYPNVSPMPEGQSEDDAVVALVLPSTGIFTVQVKSYGAGTGSYFGRFRYRKPPMLDRPRGTSQIIYLQFDGAKFDAQKIFDTSANPTADLSAFRTFLPNWGLDEKDEIELVALICAEVENCLTQVVANDQTAATKNIVVRNSQDHREFEADASVSQVVIGGTYLQFGVKTIGLASCIDPGNFSTNDKAVVLLDFLSADSTNPNSINSLKVFDPASSTELAFPDAARDVKLSIISRIVGRIALHEIGHFLGCFHCQNDNSVSCIMDQGGRLRNIAGAGADSVVGTLDDNPEDFVEDIFASNEMFAEAGTQFVPQIILTALRTGETAPEVILSQAELENVRQKLVQMNYRNSLEFGLMDRKELLSKGRFIADDDGQLRWSRFTSNTSGSFGGVGENIYVTPVEVRRDSTKWWPIQDSISERPAWLEFLNRAFEQNQVPWNRLAVEPNIPDLPGIDDKKKGEDQG